MIRRPPRSTRVRSSAASDVYKRQAYGRTKIRLAVRPRRALAQQTDLAMQALPPLELAGRLALAVGLAVFMGLAFEETYKTEERSSPGGIRTFPMLAMCGATLYLIEPAHAFAFIAGLMGLAAWLHAYLHSAPAKPEAPTFMVPASNC